jgi:hypothetical protein
VKYDAHVGNRASCLRGLLARALGRRHRPDDCCRVTPERIIGHVARLSLTPTSHRRLDGLAAGGNKAFDGSRRDTGLLGGLGGTQ